jgi:hypothetical protein
MRVESVPQVRPPGFVEAGGRRIDQPIGRPSLPALLEDPPNARANSLVEI